MPRVLIVGISTRAMAQSAIKAGYDVVSLDFFGDSDQPAGVKVHSLVRDFHKKPSLQELARCAHILEKDVDAVLVESGLENEPSLQRVGGDCERWFNTRAAVRGARDLRKLQNVLAGSRIKIPDIITQGESVPAEEHWLVKDSRHSGGVGVRDWDGKKRLGTHALLERFIPGQLASACFVANGKQASLLGLTIQYAGVPELNARAYAWCGNVAPFIDPELEAAMLQAAELLTRSFGLAGVNGIDFILHNDDVYLLEVNPRIPASVELFERWLGVNAFDLHVQGCRGELPPLPNSACGTGAWGKAILYAKKTVIVSDSSDWVDRGIVDIPHCGEAIPAGAPICTLMAHEDDVKGCWERLIKKAETIQTLFDIKMK
jgi:predicted ATP-grasp superfamily ATP-dependent carboligase